MTKAEWLAATDPRPMLEFVRGKVSDRKLRLFSLACCYRLEPLMLKDGGRGRWFLETVTLAERCWESGESDAELFDIAAQLPPNSSTTHVIEALLMPDAWTSAVETVRTVAEESGWNIDEWANWDCSNWRKKAECVIQARRLRCITGNPFCPVAVEPEWLSSTATALAEGVYADRAFDRLPILADALQDAGCDNTDVLNHCRSDAQHVRGCWVIDLLLGKE